MNYNMRYRRRCRDTERETEQRVLTLIRKYEMIRPGDTVIAGVSGGCDSVVMLCVLNKLKTLLGYSLSVLHVNHGIRGEEADADEAFVARLCQDKGLPFQGVWVDVPQLAAMGGKGMEEAAREARFQAFEKERERLLRKGAKDVRIALAHHQDDLAETVLFRLCRGSSFRGLSGIRPVRDFYIRPLLCLTRDEIEAYAAEMGCAYRTDRTNLEDAYTRNRIRHHLLPWLEEEIHPKASAHIAEAAGWFAEAEDYFVRTARSLAGKYMIEPEEMTGKGQEAGVVLLPELLKEAPILQTYVVRLAFEKTACQSDSLNRRHIQDILALFDKQTGRRIELPCRLKALRTYDGIWLYRHEADCPEEERITGFEVRIPGETDTCYGKIIVRLCRFFGQKYEEKRYTKCFDYDKIKGRIFLRPRREGDTILLGKGCGHKRLSRYLIDRKVPVQERESLPLLAVENQVLWVIGEGKSAQAAVDSQTRTVAVFEFLR